MKTFLFELCVESMNAALTAERAGADRIELCARLDLSGITPAQPLTTAVVQALSIPVHVLIRPRGGNFVYSDEEIDQMRQQLQRVKEAGAAGVAMGVLLPDGRIDVDRSRELIKLARPMKVTFHRAFDETPDLGEALEAVISVGADCLLTSGGAPNVLAGVDQLEKLVRQAGNRIPIMAGGGLELGSMGEVLERTGIHCLHGSLTRRVKDCAQDSVITHSAVGKADILDANVRRAIQLMRDHFAKGPIRAPAVQ
ncbi:MAG: copper homeostasis protein CutC [Terracidiphilus sp.]|jgi:copper homeostasis protein